MIPLAEHQATRHPDFRADGGVESELGQKLELDPEERSEFEMFRDLAVDQHGDEVFCGLSRPETLELLTLRRESFHNQLNEAKKRAFWQLQDRHEQVRKAMIAELINSGRLPAGETDSLVGQTIAGSALPSD